MRVHHVADLARQDGDASMESRTIAVPSAGRRRIGMRILCVTLKAHLHAAVMKWRTSRSGWRTVRILLVEDDEMLGEAVRDGLEPASGTGLIVTACLPVRA